MALSKERIGEIAFAYLLAKKCKDGIMLNPKEIRRDVINESKQIEISPQEGAEFAKIVVEEVYKRTITELDMLQASKSAE